MQGNRILVLCAVLGLVRMPSHGADAATAGRLTVTVGKSVSIDSPLAIQRVSVANNALAETVVIGPREVLLNGKAPGETSLLLWQEGGTRLIYDVVVRSSALKLESLREQMVREFPGTSLDITLDNDTIFLRGTVKDVVAASRAVAIASTVARTVNLLKVEIPEVEPQILLKVRFASVDRSAGLDLGTALASGAFHQATAVGTGAPISFDGAQTFSLSQAINIFLFRRDLNLAAALQLLESKHLLEMLAEPNLLAINGTPAQFVAGGEFPYPMVQPGNGGTSITIAFKEYGIRLSFLPVITPRGTIRLKVSPEVSSLDYTNSVTIAGTTVPGTSTRRVQTEVELEGGQSFLIAGLLDNQTRESFSKVPGIGDLPILGKLFQSKSRNRSHSELLVIITPEIVRPIPAGVALPDLFAPDASTPRHPRPEQTVPVPVKPPTGSLPVELLAPPKSAAPDKQP